MSQLDRQIAGTGSPEKTEATCERARDSYRAIRLEHPAGGGSYNLSYLIKHDGTHQITLMADEPGEPDQLLSRKAFATVELARAEWAAIRGRLEGKGYKALDGVWGYRAKSGRVKGGEYLMIGTGRPVGA